MILTQKKSDVYQEVASTKSTRMGISMSNEAAIIEIIVGFYKNKRESIVREWTSNGIDSRTESGLLDNPVISKLEKRSDGWYFSVQDFGMGINQAVIDNVLCQFGTSTKTHSNDLLGAYGM